MGTISGHPLSGWTAGDIIPASFWTLKFRPTCDPEGFLYVDGLGKWVSIYLMSYSNSKLVSTFGGVVADGVSITSCTTSNLWLIVSTAIEDWSTPTFAESGACDLAFKA